jgi:hypothetical protein
MKKADAKLEFDTLCATGHFNIDDNFVPEDHPVTYEEYTEALSHNTLQDYAAVYWAPNASDVIIYETGTLYRNEDGSIDLFIKEQIFPYEDALVFKLAVTKMPDSAIMVNNKLEQPVVVTKQWVIHDTDVKSYLMFIDGETVDCLEKE